MYALELTNVNKSYPGFQLHDLSLRLPAGCILGLVGENGAGKSTTIKLILDMIRRDSGEIQVLGRDNRTDFSRTKEELGVVLDEAYFPAGITARQVNAMMKNAYRRWEEERFFEYIRRFSLPENKSFKDFSRGMKMKLAIAVALSHQARLLILDEATSGLDPMVRDEIVDLFYEYTREEDHSILVSSHIISDLEKLCDYIAFLHKGRLLFCEEKDRLKEHFGLLRGPRSLLDSLPPAAVRGIRQSDYAVEALVERSRVPASLHLDAPTVEEIILLLAKGEH